jgi:filamentous hemagglutinin family protein
MNRIHNFLSQIATSADVAEAWGNGQAGKITSRRRGTACEPVLFALKPLAACIGLLLAANVFAADLPVGGVVVAGNASIGNSANNTTINQSSQYVAINWDSFNIGAGQSVVFIQPNSSSLALNRVLGSDPSSILGSLTANGQVFLINPNGILFGNSASVNVGGLVASTRNLDIGRSDFGTSHYVFSGTSAGTLRNQGSIHAADGGSVALLGASVSNQGVIAARLGSVALAAGNAMTMDVAGDGLLYVAVNQGAVNALVQNSGMIQADGGKVLLTTQSADGLLQTAVNNTGVIQAQTIDSRNGVIELLADLHGGSVHVGGTLDASAPNGRDGGFIEASAGTVSIADGSHVTTAAPLGKTGHFLIDPQDILIGPGGTISGATLSAQLVTTNVNFTTSQSGNGNGDITVNDAIAWTASGNPTTLSFNAIRDVNINAPITATNGNFSVCCGRDINDHGAITTVNGSVLLSAGRDLNQNSAITVTDGNLEMCAGNNVNVFAAITLTRGSSIPGQSLGLPLGLTMRADSDGTGPGILGGTVIYSALAPKTTVTGPNAPANIYYNPTNYLSPTDYLPHFTPTNGATLTQYMLVFPTGTKAADGTTNIVLTSLLGLPPNVTLVAGPNAQANFVDAGAGTDKRLTFSGYTLAGPNAGAYAFATSCCGTIASSSTGTITPAAAPPPPPR